MSPRILALGLLLAPVPAWAGAEDSPAAILAQAHGAAQCGLRSDRWLAPFDIAYRNMRDRDPRDDDFVYRQTISSLTCSGLRNSPTLDHLDAVHKYITGGYQ